MKHSTNLVVFSVMCAINSLAVAMSAEQDPERYPEREHLSNQQENFGDDQTIVQSLENAYQQLNAASNVPQVQKKKKKKKKDTVQGDLNVLQQGFSTEEIRKNIIAKVKIFRNLSQEQEKELNEYLVSAENENEISYNKLQEQLLETDDQTQPGRGFFGKTQPSQHEKQQLEAVLEQVKLLKQQISVGELLANIEAKKLNTEIQQLAELKQSNANMVAGYKLNKKYYIFAGSLAACGFVVNLLVAIGGYFN